LSEPEDLKNCRFFEAGCKVTTSKHFNQIFLSDFEEFFLLILPELLKNYSLFLRADGKDTRSIFISKFFLSLSSTRYSHFHFSICLPSAKNLSVLSLFLSSFSLSSRPFYRGACFKSGCKDRQFHFAAKYFYIFFSTRF